jgi:DNA polymerase V
MIDAHIYEGDILVVDRSRTPSRGRIVVASVHGGDHLFVKKFGHIRGAAALFSCNQARTADYPPILFDSDDAAEIWGIVVATVRKF